MLRKSFLKFSPNIGPIAVDHKRCRLCGTCIDRCPANFRTLEGNIDPRPDLSRCYLCGHCVALCPAAAITHKGLYDAPLEPIDPPTTEDRLAFIRLIKSRRSHRHFTETAIPRNVMDDIIELCRYSPTGVNTQTVEIKILENRARLRALAEMTVTHFSDRIRQLTKAAERVAKEDRPVPEALAEDIARNAGYDRMEKAISKGRDPIFHQAPAVLFFHSGEKSRTPRDDAVIAAHTVTLGAAAMGLGACHVGLFTRAATESRNIHEALALPDGHRLYATIIVGYPRLSFLRTAPRKPISVTRE